MKVDNPKDLPEEYRCNKCGLTKPVEQMIVVRLRREKVYYLRPRCKDCHNTGERGHRREWKRKYLRDWRKRNGKLNESYWRNPETREKNRINMARRTEKHHDALLIQGRLRRRGMRVSFNEAQKLLARFGRCYPSRLGLTAKGLRECERIRSTLRRGSRKLRLSNFDIRLMVYEDGLLSRGLFIKPERQPRPYQKAAERLRQWQQSRRQVSAKAA